MSNVVDNARSHKNVKKDVREKSNTKDFCTSSLKPELHPVSQGNSSLTLYYFKRFTKFTTLYFQNMQEYHTMTKP